MVVEKVYGMIGHPQLKNFQHNLFHHKGIAIVCYMTSIYFNIPELAFTGLVLLGHSSFDRIFGYGLKFPDNF
jgi:Domain of unknown function (DUF4260)